MGHFIEAIIFSSRWLIAPFLLGLVAGLAALVVKFVIKLYARHRYAPDVFSEAQ